jgi:hypothetical protein
MAMNLNSGAEEIFARIFGWCSKTLSCTTTTPRKRGQWGNGQWSPHLFSTTDYSALLTADVARRRSWHHAARKRCQSWRWEGRPNEWIDLQAEQRRISFSALHCWLHFAPVVRFSSWHYRCQCAWLQFSTSETDCFHPSVISFPDYRIFKGNHG